MRPYIAILCVLAACGGSSARVPPAQPGPATRTVSGQASFVTIDSAGDATPFPIDLHDTLFGAQFPSGDGWDIREGVSHTDGTFEVESSPGGAASGGYWLATYDVKNRLTQFLWTNVDALEFVERANGRGDAVAAKPGTILHFGPVADLDPLQASDAFELVIGNLGISAAVPSPGQEGLSTLVTSRPWNGNPLISGAKHDQVILSQLRSATDDGIDYLYPIRSATFDQVEQVDGGITTVSGSFQTPPDLNYDLRWNRSEFVAAKSFIHPSRVGDILAEGFELAAQPGGTDYGVSILSPAVLFIDTPFAGGDDFDHTFAIHNPYPAGWLFADYEMSFAVDMPVPDEPGMIWHDQGAFLVQTKDLPGPGHPVVPVVTAPRNPTIGGKSLFEDQDGTGLTPTVAWEPPATGTADAYVLFLQKWDIDFGQGQLETLATLIVPGDVTSVRLPGRLLEKGQHYVLRMAAVSNPGADVRKHALYTIGLPYAYADLLGNTFTP